MLFRDVTNAAALQAQLVARNRAFEYAFVDASAVASRTHVLAAVFRAVTVLLLPSPNDGPPSSSLRTPNVHSEIVYSLSPSSNVRLPPPRPFCMAGVTALTF